MHRAMALGGNGRQQARAPHPHGGEYVTNDTAATTDSQGQVNCPLG